MPISGHTFNMAELVSQFSGEGATMAVRFAANLTLAAGTVLAQRTTDGVFLPYLPGAASGQGTARAVLSKSIRTDATGRIVYGVQTPGEWGQTYLSAPVYFRGVFRRAELVGLISRSVAVTGAPTGGTFALSYLGSQTTAIAHNATAGAIQTALEALASIGAGNVVVTGTNPFAVRLQGARLGAAFAVLSPVAVALTGGTAPTVTVAEVLDETGSAAIGRWLTQSNTPAEDLLSVR